MMSGSDNPKIGDPLRIPGAQFACREPVSGMIAALGLSQAHSGRLTRRAFVLIDWWCVPEQFKVTHGSSAKSRSTLASISKAAGKLDQLIGELDPLYGLHLHMLADQDDKPSRT